MVTVEASVASFESHEWMIYGQTGNDNEKCLKKRCNDIVLYEFLYTKAAANE